MPVSVHDLPYLTQALAGCGGVLRQSPEDFRVVEVPAYEPLGDGDHVFALIEKRDLTTPRAAELMATALDVAVRDVGWAGMKDRHAVTRQLLSFPPPVAPEAVARLEIPGISVLCTERHPHKLRTGHLRGNQFTLRLRDTTTDAETAAARARAVLARLAEPPGAPNWFGSQRFGRDGDNADRGRALIVGGKRGAGRHKRLYISAYQSMLFNEFLRRRLADGLYATVLRGDLLVKRSSGGMFACDDPEADRARLLAGELAPTGPMYGHKLRRPPEQTPAADREQALLDDEGIELTAFKRVGKLGAGTRRALAVAIDGARVAPVGERAIEVSFSLPSGSYATTVMREIVKAPALSPGDQ